RPSRATVRWISFPAHSLLLRSAGFQGAAIFASSVTPQSLFISGTTFHDNIGPRFGFWGLIFFAAVDSRGAVFLDGRQTEAVFVNCVFSLNVATTQGGA